ncbi:hypothetical protein PRUPE_4G072100 [Prunus persica]|uniref:Uncharacterized protein n=1 Tax=Prunus persica TaxID=3760 RepID=M5WQC4_PRUPE|nr:hypothetical protein PRUPE_4G072100 [Prunus persica]
MLGLCFSLPLFQVSFMPLMEMECKISFCKRKIASHCHRAYRVVNLDLRVHNSNLLQACLKHSNLLNTCLFMICTYS